MSKSHEILSGPFFISVLAIAFCSWIAMGNDVNFCVTTGCALYQDASIIGLSLWWFGAAAFVILGLCAILGQKYFGRILAALFLIADIFLLLLMAFTAPCISCLTVALFFALCYFLFRRADQAQIRTSLSPASQHSFLLLVWSALFIINIGQVVKSQMDTWPILDESGDPRVRMFFSPSCRYCVEGINFLSGNVNVAFYPVAENDADVYRIMKMEELLGNGLNIAEALSQSEKFTTPSFFASVNPAILLLRFRLLCNKAHIFAAGSQRVPFLEYRGLPPYMLSDIENNDKRKRTQLSGSKPADTPTDHQIKDADLPPELLGAGQCGDGSPCP